jgi:anti-sigma regulatory factor (Ser/Thr protein kinase)
MQAEPDSVNLRVPFHAPSASVVRRELREWLAERGYRGEYVDDARVVVSELVGNSVRHAAPLPVNDLVVSWAIEDDDLVISVSDGGSGSTSPHMVEAGQAAVSGRGLSIVAALAERWWVEEAGATTTVHVRMPLS